MAKSVWVRRLWGAGVLGVGMVLSGCYVVPVHEQGRYGAPPPAPVVVVPPAPVTFTARLYPTNDMAAVYGLVIGTVTNDLHGRGVFTTQIGSETYTGEATRSGGNAREGVANGAGARGGWIQCTYRMNSATQGIGSCRLNNGAQFSMHLGG